MRSRQRQRSLATDPRRPDLYYQWRRQLFALFEKRKISDLFPGYQLPDPEYSQRRGQLIVSSSNRIPSTSNSPSTGTYNSGDHGICTPRSATFPSSNSFAAIPKGSPYRPRHRRMQAIFALHHQRAFPPQSLPAAHIADLMLHHDHILILRPHRELRFQQILQHIRGRLRTGRHRRRIEQPQERIIQRLSASHRVGSGPPIPPPSAPPCPQSGTGRPKADRIIRQPRPHDRRPGPAKSRISQRRPHKRFRLPNPYRSYIRQRIPVGIPGQLPRSRLT